MFDENLYQETISALHASEDTLSEVMNMTHKTKRRGRLRTTAVLAAVIAILCCMAAAAAALGLDQRLTEYFGATAEQEELLSTAAASVLRRLQPVSHVVELGGELADLVVPADLGAVAVRALAHLADGVGQYAEAPRQHTG